MLDTSSSSLTLLLKPQLCANQTLHSVSVLSSWNTFSSEIIFTTDPRTFPEIITFQCDNVSFNNFSDFRTFDTFIIR